LASSRASTMACDRTSGVRVFPEAAGLPAAIAVAE
jgi:hypothetical protein